MEKLATVMFVAPEEGMVAVPMAGAVQVLLSKISRVELASVAVMVPLKVGVAVCDWPPLTTGDTRDRRPAGEAGATRSRV